MSTTTNLNPLAPEYNPIPPGITPSPHAPLPFFFHPPPSTDVRPLLLPYCTQPLFQPTYYYFHPRNQVPVNPPSQTTPAASRGSTSRGGEFRRGSNRNFKNERRLKSEKNEQFSKLCVQKEENRHAVMPLKRDEDKTTVMIKNIPYDCPRKELISMLDNFCSLENHKAGNEGTSRKEADETLIPYAYDFLYLPIDFKTKKSRGFAFVNFTNSTAVWKFFDSFHLKKWDLVERSKWTKQIEIVCAKVQGKEELVKHFSGSVFDCETDEFLPVCFSPARDGRGQSVELTVVGNRRPAVLREGRSNHKGSKNLNFPLS